jgi:hypothetical protein
MDIFGPDEFDEILATRYCNCNDDHLATDIGAIDQNRNESVRR